MGGLIHVECFPENDSNPLFPPRNTPVSRLVAHCERSERLLNDGRMKYSQSLYFDCGLPNKSLLYFLHQICAFGRQRKQVVN